jgi:hypothetical protein
MAVDSNDSPTIEKKLGGCTGKGFMPGQSGNPGGRKKKPFSEAIDKWIVEHPEEVEEIVKKAFAKAKAGDPVFLHTLLDRTDGPVKQLHELAGEDGGPVVHTIRFGDGSK